jgi:hypothetical protein
METPQNTPKQNYARLNPNLLAMVLASRGNAPLAKPTVTPSESRSIDSTVSRETYFDDGMNLLPIRPKRLPSCKKLRQMSKARRALVLMMNVCAADLELEAAHWRRFHLSCDAEERRRIARNARRRKTFALRRAVEWGLWKNGRWQIGNLWMLIDTLEKRHVNDG